MKRIIALLLMLMTGAYGASVAPQVGLGAAASTGSGAGVSSLNGNTGPQNIVGSSSVTVTQTDSTHLTLTAAGVGSSTFLDNAFQIQNATDTTKHILFSVGNNATTKTLTIAANQAVGSGILNVPAIGSSDVLLTQDTNSFLQGSFTTSASTTARSGFNATPGTAPTSPNNGDIWDTTSGFFVRVNGGTIGPLGANPMTALGDIVYGGASGVPTRLGGNTTTTPMVWQQVGTGSASAAPTIAPLTAAMIPPLDASAIATGIFSPTNGGLGFNGAAASNGTIPIGTGTGFALANITATSPVVVTNSAGGIALSLVTVPPSSGGTGSGTAPSAVGQIPIATSGNIYTPATLTAGTNVTISNASGAITISAAGGTPSLGNFTSISDAAYAMLATDSTVSYATLTTTRIVTLPAASSVVPGLIRTVQDLSGSPSQTVTISIVRNGSDTIEGGTTGWTIRNPKGWRAFQSDGVSNWKLVGMSRDMQFWIGSAGGPYTWIAEPGAKWAYVQLLGAGASGSGGAQQPTTNASVGGAGGPGGGYSAEQFLISDIGTTATVAIGLGGASVAGGATTTSAGTAGNAGGNTTFAATVAAVRLVATGGGSGTGGGATTGGASGAGGQGLSSAPQAGSASTSGSGGNPGPNNVFGYYGGGGGAGGGIPLGAANFNIGGNGGSGSVRTSNFGSAGSQGNGRGNTDGAGGSSPSAITPTGYVIGGPGGGGGASSILTTGGAGGTGSTPGGGGGGGGAANNGHNGGSGGAGGDGAAMVSQGL